MAKPKDNGGISATAQEHPAPAGTAGDQPLAAHFGKRLGTAAARLGTREEAAEALRISKAQLARYIAESHQPGFDLVARLAALSGVRLAWLASGEPPVSDPGPGPEPDQAPDAEAPEHLPAPGQGAGGVPVIGLAECGLRGWYQGGRMAVTASRPPDMPDGDAFVVIAIGDSLKPLGIQPGYLCYCAPSLSAGRGDIVCVQRKDGTTAIKRLKLISSEWLVLEGWLPEEDGRQEPYIERIKMSNVERLAPLVYIKVKL